MSLLLDRTASGKTGSEPICLVCCGRLGPSRLAALLECATCGFITAGLAVQFDELKRIYGRDYFHGEEYSDYVTEEASLKANFDDRIKTLLGLLPHADKKSLFEIGCAFGFFLDLARQRFKSVAGIDISADAAGYAAATLGLDVACGDYLESLAKLPFDVFCLWDTIEHLAHPDRYIAKISREIAPNGLLALTTGDIGSLNARLRGSRWRMIHPPTHLHYFSIATVSRLLDRHGFDVVHVEHPATVRTLGAILYGIFVLRWHAPAIYRVFARPWMKNIRIPLNFYDIMYVIARRRPN